MHAPYKPLNKLGGQSVAAIPITTAMVDAALRATAAQPLPDDLPIFEVGDLVVYPAHGVGKVDRIGMEEMAGHQLHLIQISFEENRMTLRVPVRQAAVTGLRKIGTAEAMTEVLTILSGRSRVSRMIWAKRGQEYLAKINSGNLKQLAEVVRDLRGAGDGSGTSYSQRNLFELGIERLAGEFAAASGIDKASAMERLTTTLQTARTNDTARTARVAAAAVEAAEAAEVAALAAT